jgi:hypothetical protein
MGTTTISIPVEKELARIYNAASTQDREKIQTLLALWLREIAAPGPTSLGDLMDSISDRAQSRGLTPEILESLLDDE